MYEYTILVIFSLLIIFIIDVFSGNLLFTKRKFWYLILVTIVAQTVVDNYLNGRWLAADGIVYKYDLNQYSGIKIWHTPLENYFFGIGLIWLNIIIFEILVKKFNTK
jgi:lycopene cyclase domain-containing protein